ncbi:helix-turn-helix domain-containing protein [Mesorhizobium sp. ESP7-2]|uniref:helix-turn-helix domain-containing protein n=1 Tax=Mesorhizobium sp. ESP7-2 TaxID=2876622 RepID=UPI001CCF4E25|nr:helix-turn-helix domain-containing protein [Mesorhizobium sp. ESP7-2]MBZ9711561.1 helix-turn-helix domain-containing protein [Mesorhizobium sp. ESP7-2]
MALVNSQSKIEERLARWLLMMNDLIEGDKIYLTHEFLATKLGSQRYYRPSNARISGAGSCQAWRDHDY